VKIIVTKIINPCSPQGSIFNYRAQKLRKFYKRIILRLPADALEDVSVGISTLTVYVPNRTNLKLKVIKLNTLIGFGWEHEENHKTEKR
jgi:hypothetical protein